MPRRTAVAAPAPRPSAEEMLEAIARLPLVEFIRFRDRFRELTKDPPKRWIRDGDGYTLR